MGKKTTELFTPYKQQAALAGPRPVRRLRITPTSRYGRQRYYLDNWLLVPAWAKFFNDWTVGAVVRLAAGVALSAVAAAWWLLRLLGRTAR